MITELSAQNFKSWQDTGKLHFAPLTGFFGANNSGKTSLLQILLLLKQTAARRDTDSHKPLFYGDDSSLVNLSDFESVMHRHNTTFTLGISVSLKLPPEIKLKGRLTDSVDFSVSVVNHNRTAQVEALSYMVGDERYGIEWTAQGYKDIKSGHSRNPHRCYGTVNPLSNRDELALLHEAFEDQFARVHHLGPYRLPPQHTYDWGGEHPDNVGQHGERTIPILLSGRIRLRSIEQDILKRLQELQLIHSYDIRSTSEQGREYEILVTQHEGGTAVPLTDVGFGVSQILPVLVFCYSAPENSILILEQPEAHLHPKVQSELADVLIDVVKNRNIQIILESHSEHLLLRLMRRIAEYGVYDEGISADQTAFHFCEINDGNSKAEQLKVDEYGNISNWPKDFFGDEMGDLAAKTKAEMQRRKANKR